MMNRQQGHHGNARESGYKLFDFAVNVFAAVIYIPWSVLPGADRVFINNATSPKKPPSLSMAAAVASGL
jgi:hypothetical protein